MLPLLISSIVIPAGALVVFIGFRAADSSEGICRILITGSLDLCILSIGIAGAIFYNLKDQPNSAVYSPLVLIIEFGLATGITIIMKRGRAMGMIEEWQQALWTLGLGVVAIGFPAGLLLVFGRP
jgi:hypothetical protein